jgi:predicted phosphodiesterase
MSMKAVRADYPVEWPYANVYTLADLHIGDPHCNDADVQKLVKRVQDDPYGLCILNGDLMNNALRNSVSDVYGEIMTPMQQVEYLVKLLDPIKSKIIGCTTGNHENRTYKSDGIDIMAFACRELGIADKYAPEGILIYLRFGTQANQHRKAHRNPRQWYSIYATHGSGGGRKEGAKAIRLADMAAIVDADCYVHSHTHLPMVMKQSFFRADAINCCAKKVQKLFVNTGASLEYGGYGQAQEFKPAAIAYPVIHLEAKNKKMTVTM